MIQRSWIQSLLTTVRRFNDDDDDDDDDDDGDWCFTATFVHIVG